MKNESIEKLYQLVESIEITQENQMKVFEVKQLLEKEDYTTATLKLKSLTAKLMKSENSDVEVKEKETKKNKQIISDIYPKDLSNPDLENSYVGLLLVDVKSIVKYHFLFKDCYFENDELLNIYKGVLFTDGQAYAPEHVKKDFNFAKTSEKMMNLKSTLKREALNSKYTMEKAYIELRKLFELRKHYLKVPIKDIQDKIIEIIDYKLYDKMTLEEVENAINQVNVTNKFKQAVLNKNLIDFLQTGKNNLTNGLDLPFPILTSVFKGVRKGETMSVAMPSNAGKSRFTINLATFTSLVHKKKVLIISNEMSEEKMKLCLITTILNNPVIQEIHGYKLHKTEGELLEYKFRADENQNVEIDEHGFVMKQHNESQKDFSKRLCLISTEYNQTVAISDWINNQLENSIYFMNITDHTNDELRKVIMNYYYKEEIEYVFYDTLKTDIDNIGNPEEIKRTATILSNLAQNFNLFIFSTLQLTESSTLPVNLDINDLAVSRTVKEVLDTLILVKQINQETYDNYEYSLKEVDTKYFCLEKYSNPDIRYYSFVVDKNRAGAKPTLLFRLNLAYNSWEELGHLRLKQIN